MLLWPLRFGVASEFHVFSYVPYAMFVHNVLLPFAVAWILSTSCISCSLGYPHFFHVHVPSIAVDIVQRLWISLKVYMPHSHCIVILQPYVVSGMVRSKTMWKDGYTE
jgi:hypothetical protein